VNVVIIAKVNTILYSGTKINAYQVARDLFFVALRHKSGLLRFLEHAQF